MDFKKAITEALAILEEDTSSPELDELKELVSDHVREMLQGTFDGAAPSYEDLVQIITGAFAAGWLACAEATETMNSENAGYTVTLSHEAVQAIVNDYFTGGQS